MKSQLAQTHFCMGNFQLKSLEVGPVNAKSQKTDQPTVPLGICIRTHSLRK